MRSQQQPLPFSICTRSRVWITIAVAAVVAMPVPALAVDIFPPNEPDWTYDEDVSGVSAPGNGVLPSGITQYNWTDVSSGIGTSASAPTCGGGFWGTHLVQTDAIADIRSTVSGDVGVLSRIDPLGPYGRSSVFVVDQSMVGHASYKSQDWENFRFEFDFHGDANAAVGVVWGGQPAAAPNTDYEIDHGYLFYIDELPEDQITFPPTSNARWHLVKRQSGYDLELASGEIVLNDGVPSLNTVYRDQCYRLRLEYFCDTMRISIARIDCGAATCTVTQCNGTTNVCSPEDYSNCADPIEWCTLVDWVDPVALNPGLVGTFAGGIDQSTAAVSRFDNLVASAWDYSCNALCPVATSWTSWTDDWDATTVAADGVQDIDLKFLYTGAVVDPGYGSLFRANAWQDSFIDVTAWTEPTDVILESDGSSATRWACGGWTVLHTNTEKPVVDLPDPDDTDSNLAELMAFLQPMSSAVKLVYDATQLPEDRFSFVDDFDNERLDASTGLPNPDYNPAPLPAVGSTPIRNSLNDAFEWYRYQKSVGGAWYNEPLEECRLWYVIFITDGEESCCENAGGNDVCDPDNGINPVPNWACDPTGPAEKFADPESFGFTGLDPVKIYTVGFSESVAATSPLQCVATTTGGRFFSATDAGQLVDVLYDVLDEMQETDRSFIPFAVSPPPPGAAGQLSADEEFLTIFPRFVPINQRSVWDGDLYAFEFNQSQPTLPTTADCEVDTDQVVWRDSANNPSGAKAILAKQMDDYTDANPTRFVFMGSDYSGSWQRYLAKDTFTNTLLMTDFRDLLDVSSSASVDVLEAVEVVNHLRNIHTNPAALSLATVPQDPPRPDPSSASGDVSALGDIYHSQPVVVNPPNNFLYFSDFGQGQAHDYMSFLLKHQKRRRVVLAGANDGQLHVFDGGMYDRDETNYDNRHDMGTGMEIFSWVPEAVSHRLSRMTYGSEHQYLVDGLISVTDVFIDPDGSSGSEPEQWRTVALATMRRGGRGVLALDITTPDPITSPDFIPAAADFPGCMDSTSAQCDGLSYPHLLWEFHDVDGSGIPNDDDLGCSTAGFTGDDCRPYWDLGWTWSKPAIARIGVYNEDVGGNIVPEDTYVAFFGGGWDASLNPSSPASDDITGNYFYAVDIETGATVLKEDIGVSVPGAPTLLDSDNDGFHDRVYFGDTNGRIWRLDFPSPYLDFTTFVGSPTTVFEASELRRIFDVSTTSLTTTYGRQHFFNKPTLVPALFDGSNYVFAILIGAGDRANLGDETANITNHFYVVLDDLGDIASGDLAYDENALQHIAYDDAGIQDSFTVVPGETVCTDNYFNTAKGWYLELREDEKVNFEAMVFANHVFFITFEPGEGLTASNPVEICTPAAVPTPTPGPGATPTPTPPAGGGGGSGVVAPVCKASGLGRIYDLGLTCGLGEYSEVNDIVTGIATYTIGNTSYFVFTGSGAGGPGSSGLGGSKQPLIGVISSTSNWRQE